MKKTLANINEGVPDFTGVARSVQCFENQGHRNFKILTLHLEHGMVTLIEYSDPYASFEAMAKMELWNMHSIINLNNHWKDKEAIKK
jgi:hypothetical protein